MSILQTQDEVMILQIKAIQYIDQIVCFLPELLCTSNHSELIRYASQCISRFIELAIADFEHPGLHLFEPNWFQEADGDLKLFESQRKMLENRLLTFQTYDVSAVFKPFTDSFESDSESNVILYLLALLAKSQDPDNSCIAEMFQYCYDEILTLIYFSAVHRKRSLRNRIAEWITLLGNLISLIPSRFICIIHDNLHTLFKELDSKNLLVASIQNGLNHCFSRYLLSYSSMNEPSLEFWISFCLDNLSDPIVASDCIFIARNNLKLLVSIAERVQNIILLSLQDNRNQIVEKGLEAAGRIGCYLGDLYEPILAKLLIAVNNLLDSNPSPVDLLCVVRIITHSTLDRHQISRIISKFIDLALLKSCFDDIVGDGIDSDSQLQIASLLALKDVISGDIMSPLLISDQSGFVENFVNELVLAPCIFEDDLHVRILALDVIHAVAMRSDTDTIFDWNQILKLLISWQDTDIGEVLNGAPLQDLIHILSRKSNIE